MVESFLAWWMAHVPVSPKLSVFLVSMIPLIEERGGLILARMLGIPMWEAVFWCVLGNIVPIPFILLSCIHHTTKKISVRRSDCREGHMRKAS